MVTCERIMLSFFIKGNLCSKKINKIVGIMSDRCLNLITVFLHVRFEYVVSQYSFQRLYMQYLIYSMQQSTLPIASCTKRRQFTWLRKRPWIYHWRLEISRRRKVSKGRISPSKLSPKDIKSVISKFPHLLKVQPWRDIKGCAVPSKSSTRE